MATLLDINSITWQLGAGSYGSVVQGLACIRQRIDVLLRCTQGSDPLRPLFGTTIYQYIDASVLIAIPAIKAEIITAIGIWMPEITISKITGGETAPGQLYFNITYTLVDSDIIDTISYNPTDTSTSSFAAKKLVLVGTVPENPSGYQYFVALTLNGVVQAPIAPTNGFTTVNELFAFIQRSYNYLADWYLKGEGITGYLKDQQFIAGSIAVTLKQVYKVFAVIPQQAAGETITLVFNEAPTGATAPQPNGPFTTKGELLAWVQANLSGYGTWAIESNGLGDFNADFNNDYNQAGNILAIYTPVYSQANIVITTSGTEFNSDFNSDFN